jgi:hypothetical protein
MGRPLKLRLYPAAVGTEIVVWRSRPEHQQSRSRERFSVAHEIGHYCAMRRFNMRPRSRKAYWELEEACNDFAGRLLVADADIAPWLRPLIEDPRELLQALRDVQKSCDVSMVVASRRFQDVWPGISLSFFTIPSKASDACIAVTQWCCESVPWLGYRRRAHVHPDDVAAQLIGPLVDEPAGATKVTEVNHVIVVAQRSPAGILLAALVRDERSYDPTDSGKSEIPSPVS